MVRVELERITTHITAIDKKKIAEKLKLSVVTVNAVLRGDRKNIKIVEEALRLAKKNKNKQENLNEQARAL